MKSALYIVASIFIITGTACKKSSTGVTKASPASLTGKWYYTAYYYSIGGPGEWHAVNPINQWIELKADGSFSSNLPPFNKAAAFGVTDSIHIKFYDPVRPNDSLFYFYKLDSIKKELELGPANPICIEGCASRFAR